MFILAKRSILLPNKDHSQLFPVARGFTGEIPDWAAETGYFRELVQDGKIVIPESAKDRDLQAAADPEPGSASENPQEISEGSAKNGKPDEKGKKAVK